MLESSEKAIEYCDQAYKLAKSIKYKQGEALSAFNRAKIYRDSEEYDQALKYLQDALTNSIELILQILRQRGRDWG